MSTDILFWLIIWVYLYLDQETPQEHWRAQYYNNNNNDNSDNNNKDDDISPSINNSSQKFRQSTGILSKFFRKYLCTSIWRNVCIHKASFAEFYACIDA